MSFVLSCFIGWGQNPTPEEQTPEEKNVLSICKKVIDENKLATELSDDAYRNLPVGIVRVIGGKTYVVAVSHGYFDNDSSSVNAYFSFPFPNSTQQLAFAAEGIKVAPRKVTSLNGTVLKLVSKVTIPFGDKAKIILSNDGGNNVQIGCNGIEKIHLKGDIVFDEGFIQSADSAAKTVTTSFEIEVDDPNDIIVQLSLQNFVFSAMPDVVFSISQATLDMSETGNVPGMVAPQGYFSEFEQQPELWQGFYLKNGSIKLPNFLSNDTTQRIVIQAGNMIIDKTGLSCHVSVSGLAEDSTKGNNTWPITVSSVQFSLVRNELKGAGIGGKLILGDLNNEKFDYEASISIVNNKAQYAFVLGIDKDRTYQLPMLKGELFLEANSYLSIEYLNKKLIPKAVLNGSLMINQKPLNTKLVFEELTLTTQEPYVDFKRILNDDTYSQELGGFTLSISQIELLKPSKTEISIGFDASVTLVSGGEYTGAVSMAMIVKRDPVEKKWKFDKLKIDEVLISVNTSTIAIEGFLAVKDTDPVYGNGYSGGVTMSIKNVIPKISATAMFGKVNGFKYWNVDVSVALPTPISCGLISIFGFRGGAYKFMRQEGVEKHGTPAVYVPDKTIAFGLKAGVTLGLPDDKAFNADVLLDISFSSSGGINRVLFTGDAYFMKSIVERNKLPIEKLPLYANVIIDYNCAKKSFLFQVDTYMNIGNGKIIGAYPQNYAGRCQFYFDPVKWYVRVGTPKVPISVMMMNMTQTSAYIMAGELIDLPPVLPTKFSELTKDLKPMNWSSLSTGKGFAMGANLKTVAGGDAGPFYASLNIEGGFDVVINDFGDDAHCAGSTETLGINGWYAMGQCYVWLDGSIGVKLKIRGKERNFDIMRLNAAALLQAELPNPTWMQGRIQGSYNVLGGLVKGSVDYKFEVGEKCEVVQGRPNLADIDVVGEITPNDGKQNIDVFTTPQVVFNLPIGKQLKVEEFEYKIVMDEFVVSSGGVNLPGEAVWNNELNILILKSNQILPSLSEIVVKTKIHWLEYKNNAWQDAKDKDGVVFSETKEIKFKSGEAPNYIPEHNVEYCYPKQKQINFYKNEYNKGFVKLNKDQDYLFKQTDAKGKQWTLKAFFETGSNTIPSSYTYDVGKMEVLIDIPSNLPANQKIKLFLKKVPFVIASAGDNVTEVKTTEDQENVGNLTITTKDAEGTVSIGEEVTVYEMNFRTSKYASFEAKWQAAIYSGGFFTRINYEWIHNKHYTFDEPFDSDEIALEVGTNNNWYSTFIYPQIYQYYPYQGYVQFSDDFGIPPLKAVSYNFTGATGIQFESLSALNQQEVGVYYDFEYTAWDDFYIIKDKVSTDMANNVKVPQNMIKYSSMNFVLRPSGSYNVLARYKIPGLENVVTTPFSIPFNLN